MSNFIGLMTVYPVWIIERLGYWTLFALMVLFIERAIGNRDWDLFRLIARREKAITPITLLGLALLFAWTIFH